MLVIGSREHIRPVYAYGFFAYMALIVCSASHRSPQASVFSRKKPSSYSPAMTKRPAAVQGSEAATKSAKPPVEIDLSSYVARLREMGSSGSSKASDCLLHGQQLQTFFDKLGNITQAAGFVELVKELAQLCRVALANKQVQVTDVVLPGSAAHVGDIQNMAKHNFTNFVGWASFWRLFPNETDSVAAVFASAPVSHLDKKMGSLNGVDCACFAVHDGESHFKAVRVNRKRKLVEINDRCAPPGCLALVSLCMRTAPARPA